MLRFSIKNAFRKKSTAILSSVGVGIGLMLVFVIGAFTAGVSAQFQENLAETVGLVEVVEKGNLGSNSHLPLNIVDSLFETPEVGDFIAGHNVETQAPATYTLDYNDDLNNLGDSLTLIGINKTLDQAWGGPTSKILNGRVFNLNANETIIDARLLDAAQFPVSIGDTITIDLGFENANLTIVGVYDQEDNGAPDFVPKEYFLYADIQDIWNFLSISGDETNIYTQVALRFNVESSEATQVFVDKINEYSESGGYFPVEVSAFSLSAFFESIEETFAIFDGFAGIIGFITVLAGGTAIVVTQLMSVTSRIKEFAILKSTGWKNRHIFTNVIYESLTLGILGAIIGLGLGSILVFFLSTGNSPFGTASAIITLEGVIEVVAYALGLGILGGLYPGIKASRVRPVVVLKGE
ncbi:MAG: FtsX-like permease family protein [Promethearchaeota archaeon]|nr:MAG: FtsX-like permease family protein [Candidatus Lokiarchaeota archaeon]